ncbi:MAG: DUF2813 domain-containing protein, partial [Gammaproteobacteria bacterium]|nr:DUF2813 domain-containing protein [Gammaproteobacteria bacterium]
MRLSTLKIRNFRGIRSLDLRLDRDVIVLIGENNSGKTSILEAMRIGLNMIKSDKAASFSEYDFYRDQQAADLSHCDSIKLVFIFKETKEHPWDEQITRALSDVIILDNYQTIKLSIIVRFDAEEGVIKQSFGFLNDADNEMQMQQGKQQRFLKEFKKLRPFFCQSALRAAKDEFQAQGSFWSSFLGSKTLDPAARLQLEDELNQINHHVRRNRGELLFARKWLLVEGETDVSVIAECADLLDIDLNVHGIRIIECSQAGGPGIFIKVADALNIDWHLVADNDQG